MFGFDLRKEAANFDSVFELVPAQRGLEGFNFFEEGGAFCEGGVRSGVGGAEGVGVGVGEGVDVVGELGGGFE